MQLQPIKIIYGSYHGCWIRVQQYHGDSKLEYFTLFRRGGAGPWQNAPPDLERAVRIFHESQYNSGMNLREFIHKTFADDVHVRGKQRVKEEA